MSMARYLEQKIPQTISDLAKAAYIGTLCIQYQRLSKRYIPELVNSTLTALSSLSPIKPTQPFGYSPNHECPESLRIGHWGPRPDIARRMQFWDIAHEETDSFISEGVKLALLHTELALVKEMADLWQSKSAFPEIVTPFSTALSHLLTTSSIKHLPSSTKVRYLDFPFLSLQLLIFPQSFLIQNSTLIHQQSLLRSTQSHLSIAISSSLTSRKPLALHNHRPLAIKMSFPQFEDDFNPSKHYDPDRDRAEMNKLKKEHKREKKGALRELRKDAKFMAREQLKEKKERDQAYERKMRRVEAEIREG